MQRGGGRGGGLGSVVHGVVSLAAEYRAHRSEVKAQRNGRQDSNNAPSGPSADEENNDAFVGGGENDDRMPIDDDEADWQLDEAAPPAYEEREGEDESTEDDLVNEVLRLQNPSTIGQPSSPLLCPVIIPQRRPRDKKRGFVRAYAPVLADKGIDQATFLQFLKTFQKSSQASPVFPIIQVAAGIASFTPSLTAMAVCMAAQVVATVGAEIQTRQRTNTFLDRMNDELFKPHGLYAMIIKYKPKPDGDSLVQAQTIDVSTNKIVAKYKPSDNANRSLSDRMRNLRQSSGTTKGANALPEAAPLIFPDIDRAIATDGGKETLKERSRDAQKFLNAYLDRRAQTTYAASDPGSALNLPEDQTRMKSKLSDPNHPLYTGNVVDLVTGGALNSAGRGRQQGLPHTNESGFGGNRGLGFGRGGFGGDAGRGGFGGDGGSGFGRGGSGLGRGGIGRGGTAGGLGGNSSAGGPGGVFKKLMQEDVLYLLIVNMPSEADLAEAQRVVNGN